MNFLFNCIFFLKNNVQIISKSRNLSANLRILKISNQLRAIPSTRKNRAISANPPGTKERRSVLTHCDSVNSSGSSTGRMIIPVGNFSRNRSCHFFRCLDCVEFDAVTKKGFARATERDLALFRPRFHVFVIFCIYLVGPDDAFPHSLGTNFPEIKGRFAIRRRVTSCCHPEDDDDTSGVARCRFRGLNRRRGCENRGDVPA